jgi:2,3-bisphosphoglycerate-independent phosphoglycerate mutase
MIYVLLDGVGDLPHPELQGLTPLEAAHTPNMDQLASGGVMGQVISVGKGIAPESDIAVFNMLGYRFQHADYAGRGVIEAIGIGIDFRDGDLAMRGNFATLDEGGIITDRRAGRHIERNDATEIAAEIERSVRFSHQGTSVVVAPTIGHRLTVRIRTENCLSSEVTNTDPAYARLEGMGIAKAVKDFLRIDRCLPLGDEPEARLAANLVNEFTEQSLGIMAGSGVNRRRAKAGKKLLNSILLRDAGNHYPVVTPINEKYSMRFSCIVDMPVEQGIAQVLRMKTFEAGGLADYEEKAAVAAAAMEEQNAIYVHLKGPDEFGHDGDATGKTRNIEEIDGRFFGTLLKNIDPARVTVVISADHSTPCIMKGHSDDPVPVLVSGDSIKSDATERVTEKDAATGGIGLIMGAEVVKTALNLIRSQT